MDYERFRGPEQLVGRVLGSLSCLMQRRGFDPPLGRIFPVEGIFPLELTWVLIHPPPPPQKKKNHLFRMRV